MIGHDDDFLPLRRDCMLVTLSLWAAICIAALAIVLYSFAAHGHDIYEQLTKGTHCICGNAHETQLCAPVQAVPVGKDAYYLPVSGETIPAAWALPSPDERFHRCTYPKNIMWRNSGHGWVVVPDGATKDGSPVTRCFFAPMVGY